MLESFTLLKHTFLKEENDNKHLLLLKSHYRSFCCYLFAKVATCLRNFSQQYRWLCIPVVVKTTCLYFYI